MDTVVVSFLVLRRARHVEQDQLRFAGLLEHDLVQLYSRVHPAHVGLVATSDHKH